MQVRDFIQGQTRRPQEQLPPEQHPPVNIARPVKPIERHPIGEGGMWRPNGDFLIVSGLGIVTRLEEAVRVGVQLLYQLPGMPGIGPPHDLHGVGGIANEGPVCDDRPLDAAAQNGYRSRLVGNAGRGNPTATTVRHGQVPRRAHQGTQVAGDPATVPSIPVRPLLLGEREGDAVPGVG